MNNLVIITGPTAVGKTEISIELAKAINGEIISADSIQVYKYMDIGSAKITKEEMIEKIRKIDKNNKVKIAIVGKYIKLKENWKNRIVSLIICVLIIILFYVQSKTSIIVGCIVSICYALIVNFNVIRFILIKSELKSRK